MERTIIHLDLDAFYCAVEEQRDPALRGRAFAVGGRPEDRGVVASCSYAARAFGVHSAMPMRQAIHRCPRLIVVPPHFADYRAASARVMARLHALTPLVEQISIDEAFLDASACGRPGEELARELQAGIRDELGLPCSVGVASNKLVAKIATDAGKAAARSGASPLALYAVPPGQEAAFLAPLPVLALWGVGPKTAERLGLLGISTIGELAAWPANDLARRFGAHGVELARHARGLDDRPIVTEREAKSISKETTFARDERNQSALAETIRTLAGQVAAKLHREGLGGSTVKLKLRWEDFTTLTRQQTLTHPTDDATLIGATARRLLEQVWEPGRAVRLVGVGVSGLGAPLRQLTLWEAIENT
ncbi:MAG: DNA polymerase IV [Roseiflexaceae bacterium]